MGGQAISRRSFLAASGVLAVGACTADQRPQPRPSTDPDAAIRTEVASDVRRLLAAYAASVERHPSDAGELRPLMAEHRVHLRALGAGGESPASPARRAGSQRPSAGATASTAATGAPPVPEAPTDARMSLARAERDAAQRRVRQLGKASAPLARLIASIGASEAAHAAVLTESPQSPGRRSAPGRAVSRTSDVAALQTALAGEHAAIYGYGVVGAQVPRTQRRLARAADSAHRARRDQLRELLVARDATPVAAAAAYRLPYPVRTPTQARRLAVELEERVSAVWIDAVGQVEGDLRSFAATATQDAATRAAIWRGASVALPGLPHQRLPQR